MSFEVESLIIDVEVMEGRDLVPKDRNLLGKRTSSDPYINVWCRRQLIGTTKVVKKSLNPVWNESFRQIIPYEEANHIIRNNRSKIHVLLTISDEDRIGSDDPMGSVLIHIDPLNPPAAKWYDVGKGSGESYCHDARGQIKIGVSITARKILSLFRGNTHPIQYDRIDVGLSWDVEDGKAVDLDASCVAVDRNGNVLIDETVYYGNLVNTNRSVIHSGDETEGDAVGDDEVIRCHLDKIPNDILALYFILTVASPGKSFAHVKSSSVRITSPGHRKFICNYFPSKIGNKTAMFLARLARNSNEEWLLSPIEEGNHTARDFGSLIPEIKSYTRDLVPDIHVDPHARVAILRKGGAIRVRDYAPEGAIPEWLSMGLAWDVTDGVKIDLDASVICLGRDLNVVDIVNFHQLKSKDRAIVHMGDERDGDAEGDDEEIQLCLSRVSCAVKYIGFVINSYSGQELDDVAKASCHLFDPDTSKEIAKYAMSNARELNHHTALILGCLYRKDGGVDWNFRIISQPSQGKTAHDNVHELQKFLRRHPLQAPTARPGLGAVVDNTMPQEIGHNKDEITHVPASALVTRADSDRKTNRDVLILS